MAHRGEVPTTNEEERRKNVGGPQGRYGPPPPPDSPEAVAAGAQAGRGTHPPITPGASGSGAGSEQFDEEDVALDEYELEGVTSEEADRGR